MTKSVLNKANLMWIVLIVVLYVVLSTMMNVGIINSYYKITLFNICINVMLAVSLNLVIGICGQFSLGHAGFMCIGAYSAGVITKMMPNYFGLLIGLLVGFAISIVAALIVSVPTLRLKGDYLAIATLGFAEIIRILVQNMKITNGAAGLSGIPPLTTFPLLLLGVVVTIVVCSNFTRSAPGRACIAVREDEIAAEAMGINTTKYKVLAFVIGAILASAAGALFACNFYVIKPTQFTFNKSIDILVMVVFGGMGSMTSSVLAAIAIGLLNMILQNFTDIRMILYGAILVIMMIFKPDGLFGDREISLTKIMAKRKAKKEAR